MYSGRPLPGFHVTRVELSVTEVKVQGDRAKLSGMTVLETEPISLAGLRGKATREVNLRVPEGVLVQGSRKVSVTVYIEPDATPSTTAQPPNGP